MRLKSQIYDYAKEFESLLALNCFDQCNIIVILSETEFTRDRIKRAFVNPYESMPGERNPLNLLQEYEDYWDDVDGVSTKLKERFLGPALKLGLQIQVHVADLSDAEAVEPIRQAIVRESRGMRKVKLKQILGAENDVEALEEDEKREEDERRKEFEGLLAREEEEEEEEGEGQKEEEQMDKQLQRKRIDSSVMGRVFPASEVITIPATKDSMKETADNKNASEDTTNKVTHLEFMVKRGLIEHNCSATAGCDPFIFWDS